MTFSESRKQLSSFSECCIGLSVFVFVFCFVRSIVPSLWHGEMEVLQEITELYRNCIYKPVSLQRGDQRVREAPESSCGGYVQQQSEEMKPIYPNVLLLIL